MARLRERRPLDAIPLLKTWQGTPHVIEILAAVLSVPTLCQALSQKARQRIDRPSCAPQS
jgi:hypothetical protein